MKIGKDVRTPKMTNFAPQNPILGPENSCKY